MSDPSYRERTRVIHAGLPDAEKSAPFLPGPTFAAPFHLSGDPYEAEFVYGRYGNPTWTLYEQALGELEGGHAVLFASGMAAVSAVFLPRLRPGDVLVVPSDCYRGSSRSPIRASATPFGVLASSGSRVRRTRASTWAISGP